MITRHLVTWISIIVVSHAFYIPGWSIKSYDSKEPVPLYVNKVSSSETELPFAYYDLPFVCPSKNAKRVGLNLGEVIQGDRIWGSDYIIQAGENSKCEVLCEKKVSNKDLRRAKDLIDNKYLVEWIVDNLPGATVLIPPDRSISYYTPGFKLGTVDKHNGKTYINNHVLLVFRYRQVSKDDKKILIVGFEVYPKSVSYQSKPCPGKKDKYENHEIDITKDEDTIRYTYEVRWLPTEKVQWANRWDMYLQVTAENLENEDDGQTQIFHVFSLVNRLVIAGAVALIVAVVLYKTVIRDISTIRTGKSVELGELGNENNRKLDEDSMDEISGWKLVHGDVFRPPNQTPLLSALLGSGVQFLVMTITVLSFACLGFLNPSYRGGLISYALFLFAFSGIFAGYVNGRMNKNLNQENWARGVLMTATIVPAVILLMVLTLNMFVWSASSSSALPFGTIVALFALWLLISCPLVIIGSFLARKADANSLVGRANQIPRQIPPSNAANTLIAVLVGGFVPFVVIVVELVSIFSSLWKTKTSYYYMYGFFVLIFVILIITVMEMSVLSTYMMLNKEDYRWWWRSFWVGAGSGIWIFLFSIVYYFTTLHIGGFVSTLLFFGYSLIGCLIYSLVTGTIGFFASYLFVQRIYVAIKQD